MLQLQTFWKSEIYSVFGSDAGNINSGILEQDLLWFFKGKLATTTQGAEGLTEGNILSEAMCALFCNGEGTETNPKGKPGEGPSS